MRPAIPTIIDILMSISDNDLNLLKDIDNALDESRIIPTGFVRNVRKNS